MLFVGFQQVIEHRLDLIRLGSDRVGEQCLIRRFTITVDRGLDGQHFIRFDGRDQPELG
jgi:hypothetical protein